MRRENGSAMGEGSGLGCYSLDFGLIYLVAFIRSRLINSFCCVYSLFSYASLNHFHI